MTSAASSEPFSVEIIVEGSLDPRRAAWFDGMIITSLPEGRTRISGAVADHAALFALISRIRDLGLRLISINRIS